MRVHFASVSLPLLLVGVLFSSVGHAQQWMPPTAEELALTSVPEAPGASAICLFREQKTEDKQHMFSVHSRVKVLTAAGAEHGDIELRYLQGGSSGFSLDELAGRTIHPDGTVIPFTGKPYDKLISKASGHKYMAKIFSLPDVTPGSILEYRYKVRYNDNVYVSPDWYVQDDLYTRRVHYLWHPTDRLLVTGDDRQQTISTISWTPILPAGAAVQQSKDASGQLSFELNASNIPALFSEEHAPPLESFSYRVLFYFTPYRSHDEFWSKEGKYWAKKEDKFIGPGPAVKGAVAELVAPTDTPDQKLHKLYTAVGKLDNSDNTRAHTATEDKAQGLNAVRNTDDVWLRRRGTGDQLADLFVAMARAAGFKAYAMSVTRRDRSFFFPDYLSTAQLDDTLAIVNVDGKEQTFDPGTHLCPFHELAWQHQGAQGLRQVDGGSSIASTTSAAYTSSHVTRIADLVLDEHGVASGTLTLTYSGSPALRWRQKYAVEDEAAVRHDLTTELQEQLPGSLKLSLTSLTGIDEPEQPLVAKFGATGPVGSAAGHRLVLPAALFESTERPMFPHEKRELAVSFDYPYYYQDAVRFKLPATLALESTPAQTELHMEKLALFRLKTESTPTSVTARRDEAMGQTLFLTSEYPALRKFRQTVESSDQEGIVLKTVSGTTAAMTPPPSSQGK